eukprot:GHVT01031032.1.p1 GENE.GHVT01031032.1~~GHVT01031032.1.p1  ORF type:complete len:126 (+),score=8.49 GHVT01031032.1:452-829(+)
MKFKNAIRLLVFAAGIVISIWITNASAAPQRGQSERQNNDFERKHNDFEATAHKQFQANEGMISNLVNTAKATKKASVRYKLRDTARHLLVTKTLVRDISMLGFILLRLCCLINHRWRQNKNLKK